MCTSFYTNDELLDLGFQCVGSHVLISRKASLYGTKGMQIGDNVRIDDFCILSGEITLGSNIHIGAYSSSKIYTCDWRADFIKTVFTDRSELYCIS